MVDNHVAGHFGRIVDDDVQQVGGLFPERSLDETPDLHEVFGRGLRARQHHLQRLAGIGRIEQDAQQVEDFLGRAHAAREHHDAVRRGARRLRGAFRCPA